MTLKRTSLMAMLCAAPLAFAQISTPVQDPRNMPAEVVPTPSETPAPPEAQQQPQQVIVLPERVIETKVDLTSGGPQSPQSARDARIEAVNSLAEVRAQCRREGSSSARSECMRNAQEQYNAVMAKTGGRH